MTCLIKLSQVNKLLKDTIATLNVQPAQIMMRMESGQDYLQMLCF